MKFSQVFGNFTHLLQSPFSARKRKRDQVEAGDSQCARPSKLAQLHLPEAAAPLSPPALQTLPNLEGTSAQAVPFQARPSQHLQQQAAGLHQPAAALLQHSAQGRFNPAAHTALHPLHQTNAQQAAPLHSLHRTQQPPRPQLLADAPYDQLTRPADQVSRQLPWSVRP